MTLMSRARKTRLWCNLTLGRENRCPQKWTKRQRISPSLDKIKASREQVGIFLGGCDGISKATETREFLEGMKE